MLKDQLHQLCSNRFSNFWALRMRLSKGMKKEILRAYSWDKCRLMIFKRSFLIETISNSLNKGKKLKNLLITWNNKWVSPVLPDTLQITSIPLSQIQICLKAKQTLQANFKWIVSNTFNTNASRLSWKKNMIKESISFTSVLRKGSLNRGHIRMLI